MSRRSKYREEILDHRRVMVSIYDKLIIEALAYERLIFHPEADPKACDKKARGFREAARLVALHGDLTFNSK